MSESEFNDRELNEFELALGGLSPAGSRIDRDRLMFRLGQMSASRHAQPRRSAWAWPAATAALVLVSIGLTALLTNQPSEKSGTAKIVDRTAAQKAVEAISSTSDQERPGEREPIEPAWSLALAEGPFAGPLTANSLIHRRGSRLPFPPRVAEPLVLTSEEPVSSAARPDRRALRLKDRQGWQDLLEPKYPDAG